MSTPLITLTSDFGDGSPYVAQMKGVAFALNPSLTLVDITHGIAPQNVREGAIVLADSTGYFPPDTIHVCVVDPGVGTERPIVYAEIGNQRYIAPNNGLLSLVARGQSLGQVLEISLSRYWRSPVSATFHGRDIMAPVAAHLSRGVEPRELGPSHAKLVQLDWPEVTCAPNSLSGSVLSIDRFGNLITNIMRSMLPQQLPLAAAYVTCASHAHVGFVHTYGHAEAGTTVALFGSTGRLEIAITNGNAAETLSCGVDQSVRVHWAPADG